MGLFDRFKRAAAISAAGSATSSPLPVDIVSPLSTSQMTKIVWSDVFGTTAALITREEALALPAVFKARAVLLALLADKPLIAYDGDELDADAAPLATQPAWLRRTAGAVSPWHRMAATLDDLVFYGWSLWVVRRDGDGVDAPIVEAERVPIGAWKFDPSMHVLVEVAGEFVEADERDVVLIPGPSEGLLAYATRSLTGATEIEQAWVERAKNPVAQTELHQTVESNLSPAEAQQVVDDWNAARKSGGAAFTPHDITAIDHGQVAADLYIEGRNAARIDVGNFFNLPASLLDGSVSTASLTYSTQEGDANEVALYALPYWSAPITGRFSQDDVAGAGVFIRQHLGGLVSSTVSATGDPGNE